MDHPDKRAVPSGALAPDGGNGEGDWTEAEEREARKHWPNSLAEFKTTLATCKARPIPEGVATKPPERKN